RGSTRPSSSGASAPNSRIRPSRRSPPSSIASPRPRGTPTHTRARARKPARPDLDFADPNYELALDWIAARDAIQAAQQRHDAADAPPRILLISGSSRSEHTCPSEMSKSFRLCQIAHGVFAEDGATVDFLDLSRLASEYGRHIHPCKACFS